MATHAHQHVLLSAAKLQLNLVWRPRDQNSEADALTNGIVEGFDSADRIEFTYEDLPLDLLHELWETKKDFDNAKEKASMSKASGPRHHRRSLASPLGSFSLGCLAVGGQCAASFIAIFSCLFHKYFGGGTLTVALVFLFTVGLAIGWQTYFTSISMCAIFFIFDWSILVWYTLQHLPLKYWLSYGELVDIRMSAQIESWTPPLSQKKCVFGTSDVIVFNSFESFADRGLHIYSSPPTHPQHLV